MKKLLSILIVMLTLVSLLTFGISSVSAESGFVAFSSSADESSADEIKLVITDKPYSDLSAIEGTVVGKIGDTNKDDKVNIKDATTIQKHLAKLIYLSEGPKLLADCDNNSKLNVRDATTIQKYLAGIKTENVIMHILYEEGIHIHAFEEYEVLPDCDSKGFVRRSCICGEEYVEYTANPVGHIYKDTQIVKPTCVDKGYALVECKNCDYSYKKSYVDPTGEHTYNIRNICVVCNAQKKPFEILRDYVIANGKHDTTELSWTIRLDTGYDVDWGEVTYYSKTKELSIDYNLKAENGINEVEVRFNQENSYFTSSTVCPGYFEGYSKYNTRYSQTISETYLANFSCLYYTGGKEYPEEICMQESIRFINTALAVYQYNEPVLPVTLYDLGFTSFKF